MLAYCSTSARERCRGPNCRSLVTLHCRYASLTMSRLRLSSIGGSALSGSFTAKTPLASASAAHQRPICSIVR
eukprot:3803441-Lingulodinium_polyedra.AAC.1